MNGQSKLLLDTNAVIALLKGDSAVAGCIETASVIYVSVLSIMEFLSYRELSDADQRALAELLADCQIIGIGGSLNPLVIEAARLRRTLSLRLPDAIIAASALSVEATLVTRDHHFKRVPELSVLAF